MLMLTVGIVIGLFAAAAYPEPSLLVRSWFINAWRRIVAAVNKPPEPPTR